MKNHIATKFLCLIVVFLWAGTALAQEGTITGQIIDSESDEPLPGATVLIEEYDIGATADAEGEFVLTNVPAGTHVLAATFVGYSHVEQEVQVSDGEDVELTLELEPDVFGLDELVVTGVVGDTEARYTPFSVGRVTSDDIRVAPPVSAEGALRGRVAGVSVSQGSGQPGEAASIQLRGVTSMSTSNEPLFIVDGVILGASSVDIDALDIQDIQVIRGASAASLYGSRAANGVVEITTESGEFLEDGATEITIRNEYGISSLEGDVDHNTAHRFALSGDPDQPWIAGSDDEAAGDVAGEPTDNLDNRALAETPFYDKDYPDGVETWDQIDRFFDPGNSYSNFINVRSRVGATNFSLSFNNTGEEGVLETLDGYNRRSFRSNIDSELTDNLSVGFRGYYSWSERDHVQTGSGSPFFGLAFALPEIDLMERDDDGRILVNPAGVAIEENPMYDTKYNDRTQRRQRIMGSLNADWDITDWFALSGDFSYDRSNRNSNYFYPHFWDAIDQNQYPGGGIWESESFDEAINASADALFSQNFGALQTQTRLRWLIESQEFEYLQTDGNDFAVQGVPTFDNLDQDNVTTESESTTVRSEGFFAITNLNYDNRYIFDLLGRRDGSSLFGEDARWNNYYRASASWNISNEDFFTVDPIDDMIVRASRGTSGNRPTFSMQYETFGVTDGFLSKGALGNRELVPETATETEFGFQLGLFDRLLFEVTLSRNVIEDQLLLIDQQALQGFSQQWQNAGTLETDAFEASLDAFILQTENTSLSMGVNYDQFTSTVTEFNAPPHRYGTGGGFAAFAQASDVFLYQEGEEFGTFYGQYWATGESTLPHNLQDYSNYFDENDDGYLVPVGEGGSWRDGNWGETVEVGGESLDWGIPVAYTDEDGNDFQRLGNAIPDFNLSWTTQLTHRNFGFDMMWEAQYGGKIYNHTRAWAYRDERHGDFDQRDVPEDERKTTAYYAQLYNVNSSSSHFVEDGDFIKLRELSLSYQIGQETLSGLFGETVNYINFRVTGRNLLTFTDYTGFDPEVGTTESNHIRFDSFNYPNYRTITGSVEIQF